MVVHNVNRISVVRLADLGIIPEKSLHLNGKALKTGDAIRGKQIIVENKTKQADKKLPDGYTYRHAFDTSPEGRCNLNELNYGP